MIMPEIVIGKSPLETFGAGSCEVVTSMDVIEHVVDDAAFLRELRQMATKAVYVSTPNLTRSGARNSHHAREYTIPEFANIFRPSEMWVGSPDGWYHRTLMLSLDGDQMRHGLTGESWPIGNVPAEYVFNQGSPDGLVWGHFCAVFAPSTGSQP